MFAQRVFLTFVVLLPTVCGCKRAAKPLPPSQAVVQDFCDALIRRDCAGAYALLAPQSQARCDRNRFSLLLSYQLQKLGFAPEAARVQSCQERESTAIAQIVFVSDAAVNKRYRDSVALCRCGEDWKIVLPENFGRKTR